MRFSAVLFDLDGTLIEHLPAIHAAYGHTLPQLGLPAPTRKQVKNAIGGGLPNAMRKFVPADRVEEALAIYRPYWDAHMLNGVSLMPGGRELLTELTAGGTTLGVFTNKLGRSARAICAHLGVAESFKVIFGAEDTPWLKPDPHFAQAVLDAIGVSASETCLVGDSPWDVAAASRAGMGFIGVSTGTHTEAELREAGAGIVVDGLPEAAAHLR